MRYALTSLPVISLPTVALFFAEVRGYSQLYDSVDECRLGRCCGCGASGGADAKLRSAVLRQAGWGFSSAPSPSCCSPTCASTGSIASSITSAFTRWVRAWAPVVELQRRHLGGWLGCMSLLGCAPVSCTGVFAVFSPQLFHKPHHIWKIPTPFASHAFHPVDGFLQGFPYHLYPFLFPLHKVLYLLLYVFVNIWTISIHDGDYRVPAALAGVINGAAHHTDHHLFFDYNYGQYFTLWDRLGGSYRHPSALMGEGPQKRLQKEE